MNPIQGLTTGDTAGDLLFKCLRKPGLDAQPVGGIMGPSNCFSFPRQVNTSLSSQLYTVPNLDTWFLRTQIAFTATSAQGPSTRAFVHSFCHFKKSIVQHHPKPQKTLLNPTLIPTNALCKDVYVSSIEYGDMGRLLSNDVSRQENFLDALKCTSLSFSFN